MQVNWQSSYILHSRPYRDTSLLLELFTLEQGKFTAVARGAKKRGKGQGSLQAFTPLLTQCVGKSDLLTLQKIEATGMQHYLSGDALLSGFYLNELLVRTLQRFDPHPQLYQHYAWTLSELATGAAIQPLLRQFELVLLRELGYAFDLEHETHSQEKIQPAIYYRFDPSHGFQAVPDADVQAMNIFKGASLLALQKLTLETPEQLRDAKRLMRTALAPLLGYKPLQTRSLFLNQESIHE